MNRLTYTGLCPVTVRKELQHLLQLLSDWRQSRRPVESHGEAMKIRYVQNCAVSLDPGRMKNKGNQLVNVF